MKLFEADELDIPKLPILYKKTSTGAIQFWKVTIVYHKEVSICVDLSVHKLKNQGEIIYEFGQLNTDRPQVTNDFINAGKNIGKLNETSVLEQTILEAKAKWEKQKKKGYVESIKDAESGKIDSDLIKGGINPMLAHKFRDHASKITFPAYSQPKFDGSRMIAIINSGKCTLWSRTRKQIKSLVHIEKELENLFADKDIILDGEAYNHDYKDRFEALMSAIRKDEPHENSEIIQYHIYDCITDGTFKDRINLLNKILPKNNKFLKKVETVIINDEIENIKYYKECMNRGYEGSMIRNSDGLYEFKRSYDLQKVKQFDDAEFEIVGVEEGSGKLRGHVGAFICITPHNKKFNAKMSGDVDKLKEYFENPHLWKDRKLTVQFQGWTNKENVPRFPVGLRIRDDV